MLADILVLLDYRSERAGLFARSIAFEFGAFLTGACPAAPSSPVEPPGKETDVIGLPEAALARFEQNAREANLRVGTLEATADQEIILAIARTYDLLVVEQKHPKEAKPTDDYIEALLLFSGRPSVIVPYIDIKPVGFKSVAVAWDGSASAARALSDALPLLKKAELVEVVTVGENVADERLLGARLVQHLACHKIDASYLTLPKLADVADALLSHVAKVGSDLLIMGAYDHSRLRERVLGGVSREILRSMTVPVFMSH
jgi:nucleotide-binding universal stress UspA family protein